MYKQAFADGDLTIRLSFENSYYPVTRSDFNGSHLKNIFDYTKRFYSKLQTSNNYLIIYNFGYNTELNFTTHAFYIYSQSIICDSYIMMIYTPSYRSSGLRMGNEFLQIFHNFYLVIIKNIR